MKSKSAGKVRLTSYDDLFGEDNGNVQGQYTTIPLSQLHSFKNHPFRVMDDEKMQETVESVEQYGIIQPGIVRPCESGYEVVAGHRRWRACELAGLTEMPVIIRELDDDAATVLMVDTNIQVLFTAECFKSLSCEAKVLYGLMLDRMSLSIKNRWLDGEDRVYIIFTVEEIMELLGCGRQKAIKNIAELDSEKGIGLIEKKRLGLGKPNVIYVKNFMIKECPESGRGEIQPENTGNTQKCENQTSRSMKSGFQEVSEPNFQKYENQTSGSMKSRLQEIPESDFKKCENQTSGSMKIKLQEVPKSNCNNTDINKTDFSETDPIQSYPSSSAGKVCSVGEDVREQMETYRKLIHSNIDYECFLDRREREDVDELVELMLEILMMSDNRAVRIGGVDKPVSVVKSRFLNLTYSHIEYVLLCLHRNTTKVANIKAYLLTSLYNSTMTMNHYYQAAVNHDLYGGD